MMDKSFTSYELDRIQPQYNQALFLRDTGRVKDAIKILKNLNKQYNDKPALIGTLGSLYFNAKDWKNCSEYTSQGLKLQPESEYLSLMLFHSLWHLKKFDDALEEIKRFIALNGYSKEYDLILKEIEGD
jgi:predicted Zn-dependent protease